jgi:hypothetical protein
MKKAYFRIYEAITAGVVCAMILGLGKGYLDMRTFELRLSELEKASKESAPIIDRFMVDENAKVSLVLDDFRLINSTSTKDELIYEQQNTIDSLRRRLEALELNKFKDEKINTPRS